MNEEKEIRPSELKAGDLFTFFDMPLKKFKFIAIEDCSSGLALHCIEIAKEFHWYIPLQYECNNRILRR